MKAAALPFLWAMLAACPAGAGGAVDPFASPLWSDVKERVLGSAPYVFDSRVEVRVPAAAENSGRLPVSARVKGLGRVRELVLFADFNPIPKILTLRPKRAESFVATYVKINMASPIRAAALAEDGVWHVGGAWVDAAGGGCTLPSAASADPVWQSRLGETRARAWRAGQGSRVRLSMIHPMDTGLAAGIPAFYLETARIRSATGEVLAELETFEPVSENPLLTLEVHDRPGRDGLRFEGRDNGGNEFSAVIREEGAP